MPIKKAAKKYIRVTGRKTAIKNNTKGIFRSAVKKTEAAIAKGDAKEAKKWLQKSLKALDKAVQKKVLHKNTAARKKSRLNAKVKVLIKK
jgi:small subunit ribosomal protein S20